MTMPEERFHAQFGEDFCSDLVKTDEGRRAVQAALDKVFPMMPSFFGRAGSANNAIYRKWGIKMRTNEENARRLHEPGPGTRGNPPRASPPDLLNTWHFPRNSWYNLRRPNGFLLPASSSRRSSGLQPDGILTGWASPPAKSTLPWTGTLRGSPPGETTGSSGGGRRRSRSDWHSSKQRPEFMVTTKYTPNSPRPATPRQICSVCGLKRLSSGPDSRTRPFSVAQPVLRPRRSITPGLPCLPEHRPNIRS